MVALAPNDMDFIQNFSTIWAVFLGALLATLGGFGATQLEWFLERRQELDARLATLMETREGSYDFIMENGALLKGVIRDLEPIARFSFDDVEKAVRNA